MNVFIALLSVLLTYAVYRLAFYYLQRSQASFRAADRVGADMATHARTLLDRDIPLRVAKLVVAMSAGAGCGCFVRGIIMVHYVPGWLRPRAVSNRSLDAVFEEIENLDAETKQIFWKFQIAVMVYDSFRNPAQGWLFRHAVRSMLKVEAPYAAKREAQTAIFSVVSRRKSTGFKGLIPA